MFNEVKELLTKQLRLKDVEITPASRIKDDLGADSLDILQLLMTIEEERGITIPDEELAHFTTVGDIVSYLETR
ncbi:MAG: acyl carrier protein [Oscillospiraceae bacterium]|jgi:acyl carrier protein|nr:acyl carrier protein [Oscillospiraceae bacterium]MBQ2057232.1 acyl carrier protein [Oscillospiraceae bacterium]MBQ2158183.1 acyl carrier protein [Oscillospiraceae bacterium]MBQ2230527.1 acyl carrier protein [Oscillospiraceae bacterium]MBQ3951773.1 acyl carrier protein [Oscillospiraceae bacterium]